MEDELSLYAPYDKEFNPDGEEVSDQGPGYELNHEDLTQDIADTRKTEGTSVDEKARPVTPSASQNNIPKKRKRSRWERSTADVEDKVKKMVEAGKKSHWGTVNIPPTLWQQVQMARRRTSRTPELWIIKLSILQKIIFADRVCQTSTPISELERIIWEN